MGPPVIPQAPPQATASGPSPDSGAPDPIPDSVPDGVPSGIIVIFGAAVRPDGRPSATLRHRVSAAAALGRRMERPVFIPTGAKGRFGEAEAAVMDALLREAGFTRVRIIREESGTDTLSSARAVARIVRDLPTVPVYACTSAYHLPRCVLLLRLAGLPARACPPADVPAATGRIKRWYWRLREIPAIPYDAVLMLWHRTLETSLGGATRRGG
ncbi:MAG TPA: YdcF family protein [Rhodopila sp.]|uniref:YdcF family protein n=1 Tax=Rhodopila sp. TaxID=2480087 RepID=UPI002C9D53D6|nr:YdcF family protein [Rhodopila sp.]HVY14351.1 YdcF family protein [Rhodopila sp.]